MDFSDLGQLSASVNLKYPALGKFTLWWLSIESNSLKVKGNDEFEHSSIKTPSLLPLPFNANSILLTFSSVHPGMFLVSNKVSRESHQGFLLHPWLLGAQLMLVIL